MAVKPLIGFRYQLPIKTLFTAARITRDEKDSLALRVESESNAPNGIVNLN
jgi:hypothetical protein